MENFLSGGIEELEAAKRAIIEEAEKNLAADEAKSAYKAKDKELNAKRMFMSDRIDSAVKNRRNELEKDHDSRIEAARKDVKEARRNKKEALSKAVNQRVKDETADLVAANKKLKKENKALFKAAKIPAFCNTKFYYALFAPRSGADFLVFVVTIIIAAAVIPNVVCAFVDWVSLFKILLYVGIVFFLCLIYFIITIWTKAGQKVSVLEDGRPNMKQIKANKKAIRKLKKGIKKDGNEQQYGLESYDVEIDRREGVFEEKTKLKQKAMEEFDNVTTLQIRKEIEDEIVPQIEKLSEEAAALEAESSEKSRIARQASENLAAEYVIYLSEKYASCEKIDELINIIKEGKANNISEALDIAKGVSK